MGAGGFLTVTGLGVGVGGEASLTNTLVGALGVDTLSIGTQLRLVQTLINVCERERLIGPWPNTHWLIWGVFDVKTF